MSDIYSDLREIRERLLAAQDAVLRMAPTTVRSARAAAEIRKAINIADEWLEDE